MRVGGSCHSFLAKSVKPLINHLQQHASSDFLLYVDGHTDYKSGELIFGKNIQGDEVSDTADKASGIIS